jgi:hypothetical protein
VPYETNEVGQRTTPGGCRVDRGLCLESIEFNVFQEYIRFGLDGKFYYVQGSGLGELFAEMTNRPDPGCVWNNVLGWGRKGSGLLTTEPPHDDDQDIWRRAFPPDYVPQ